MPNFAIIENAKYTKEIKNFRRRNIKLFDPVKFQYNSILLAVETDDAFTFFHKTYFSLLNSQAPLKFLTKKDNKLEQKTWITKGLLVSIRVKSKLNKLLKYTKKKDSYNKFKTYGGHN